MTTSKENMTVVWASAGSVINPGNAKINTGWEVEIPDFETMNFQQNRMNKSLKFLDERGIGTYSDYTNYAVGGIIQGDQENILYQARNEHNVNSPQAPRDNTSHWRGINLNEVYKDTGSANQYFLTGIAATQTRAYDGLIISFIAENDNTGASTINVSDFSFPSGDKVLRPISGTGQISKGDIQAGHYVRIQYRRDNNDWLLLNPRPKLSRFIDSDPFDIISGTNVNFNHNQGEIPHSAFLIIRKIADDGFGGGIGIGSEFIANLNSSYSGGDKVNTLRPDRDNPENTMRLQWTDNTSCLTLAVAVFDPDLGGQPFDILNTDFDAMIRTNF